jgi:sigma-B regulation protein RsbU (phosphoserine phosphatase)
MRIHTKLLLLLLLIALLPLAVLSIRGQRATEAFGLAIADQGRAVVNDEIETRVQQTVAYASAIISAQQRHVETAVRLQKAEVERRLAGPEPTGEVPLYFASDFANAGTWPPGTELALDHVRPDGNGHMNAIPISRLHQSFYLAGGQNMAELPPQQQAEARRLSSMEDVYRTASQAEPGLYYWQFSTLEDGLHSVFPGHGDYPETFDPRKRGWYQGALHGTGVTWTPPMVDVSTRRLLMNAAIPLQNAAGEVIGVTGIDMDILSRLAAIQADLGLGGGASGYIVRIADHDGRVPAKNVDPETLTVRMLASADTAKGTAWDAEIDQPILLMGEDAVAQDMIRDVLAGRAGLRHIPRDGGVDTIWVYGPIPGLSAALLYVVPARDVSAMADRARESIWNVTTQQLHLALIASLGLMMVVAAIALLAARTVSQPLRHLAEVARGVAGGRLDLRAEVESTDEVGELAVAFNAMVPELRSHIKTKEGLALAHEVQQKLLPVAAPVLDGYNIAGLSIYSEDVGGDYYDFLEMTDPYGNRRMGLVVGDVTGHGVAAAMTMTTVRVLLRSYAGNGEYLLPAIRAVNHHLVEDASGGRFVTLLYLVIDPTGDTRQMRWISAGQGPILFYDADAQRFEELEVNDIPLGVEMDWTFHETVRTEWPKNGLLAVGTDGIWETVNADGESFGKERFTAAIAESAHLSAQDICHAVANRLSEFRGEVPQRDDVTLVVVKFV